MAKQKQESGLVWLKFTGSAHRREFRKEDFTRHGIDDQGAVHFGHDNNYMAEVSAAAATFLIAHEDGDMREATEDDDKALDLTRPGAHLLAGDALASGAIPVSPGAAEGTVGSPGTAIGGSTAGGAT